MLLCSVKHSLTLLLELLVVVALNFAKVVLKVYCIDRIEVFWSSRILASTDSPSWININFRSLLHRYWFVFIILFEDSGAAIVEESLLLAHP